MVWHIHIPQHKVFPEIFGCQLFHLGLTLIQIFFKICVSHVDELYLVGTPNMNVVRQFISYVKHKSIYATNIEHCHRYRQFIGSQYENRCIFSLLSICFPMKEIACRFVNLIWVLTLTIINNHLFDLNMLLL